ncbi:MAG: mercury resistance system transport protein MerF [Betaproteobacteria bacterium]|nr:mercury resistance system transport protein MerF [Betaproteobacteria bacterium]
MDNRKLLKTGIAGSVIAAVCCFTPILVIVLGAAGLAAWIGWLDYVLWPALALFLGITAYALWRRNAQRDAACCATDISKQNR